MARAAHLSDSDRLSIAIIGRGAMGHAMADALRRAGIDVRGPLGRGERTSEVDAVLLCVPEPAIQAAAASVNKGLLVGHCSASAPLDVLAPRERFVIHPLMTVTKLGARFAGAACAIDGSSERALNVARRIADILGMRPMHVLPEHRPLYHAAAVMASNFLVALESAAERVALAAGVDRSALTPLVQATVDNWGAVGPQALTGPIARGDEQTTARLRAAIADAAPDLLPAWDALADITRVLARDRVAHPPASHARAETDAPRAMRIVRTVSNLHELLRPARARGQRIGLVPTMGALHEGHLSLMRRAAGECDLVVATIFVNPTQFDDPADLAAYPRDEARDMRLAESAGVHITFIPAESEIYPAGFSTTVEVRGLTDTLEGAVRGAGHFRGVATVVTKLLNIVRPDVAYFGQKDAQQALVVRRLARDLDLGTRIQVCPIVREPDGLAMSSRNARLSGDARARAVALSEALQAVNNVFGGGERDTACLAAAARARLAARGITAGDVDYVAVVDAETLAPVQRVDRPTLVALAARVGGVRLIDNVVLTP